MVLEGVASVLLFPQRDRHDNETERTVVFVHHENASLVR